MKLDLFPGQRAGQWALLEYVAGSNLRKPSWKCQCSCGAVKTVGSDNLRRGKSKSCGCAAGYGEATRKHDLSRDLIFGVWRNMMSRCYNPSNAQFSDYGGRGITVHAAWRDLLTFVADVGPHPRGGLTFDREENDGNYEPGNVRWATRAEQARNKRNNRVETLNGSAQCLTDWAGELGVTVSHLYRRMQKGMTFAEAVADVRGTPPQTRGPYKLKPKT